MLRNPYKEILKAHKVSLADKPLLDFTASIRVLRGFKV